MNRIREVLGVLTIDGTHRAIGILENGKFAVGNIREGQPIDASKQFACLDSTYDHWYSHLPSAELP
jgi:hypothetical protein